MPSCRRPEPDRTFGWAAIGAPHHAARRADRKQLRLAAYLRDERHEVLLEPTIISENFLFFRQAMLAGLGVGLVPDYLVQDDLKRGAVLSALDAWRLSIFGTHMYMLYTPNRHHARAAATFIDFVLEQEQGSGRRGAN
jgi:DNA-binding transcriptional LysR family regulator